MTFHEFKAKLLEFFDQLDKERMFESEAQRLYVRGRIEDAASIEMLSEARHELLEICENEIKDSEWILEQMPIPDLDIDEIKRELEEHKLLTDREAHGNIELYCHWNEGGCTDARLEGSNKELLLTETHNATTTVKKYRISTTVLIGLIKEHGIRE